MLDLAASLAVPGDNKILLVVLDGLGGVPRDTKTELEAAWIPNLDRLAARSSLGMTIPVEIGITPGSGPAHIALFGYDPLEYIVGRGVIEALGIGIEVAPGDVCARANFATLAGDGTISDRRAGRLPTARATELCALLQEQIPRIGDCEVIIRPGREHRFVVVFRGPDLSGRLTETDPQHTGVPPLPVKALVPEAEATAGIVNELVRRARETLTGQEPANGILLRGLGELPRFPGFADRYKLRAACVAVYPMYRGLARLVGMNTLEAGTTWLDEVEAVRRSMADHDFCYLHIKDTDKAGEDGDFDAKVELLERFDEEVLPRLLDLRFDVLCITGDHSTPATMKRHSWHPVPFLLYSKYVRPQVSIEEFGERNCLRGNLGTFRARQAMALMLSHADRLAKFGA
ncbi:MAG TPA: 2,3-bisphosphoglycerate-independent phosphoglycerate mutase [candidate division WOR-3 bacterium]|uniref:2,3-bisphosphoglycerate-independent phosphoglycerate mutase n=1 Tax=candidate division WOR-3 bacterium TaxID=2052148 RepID=A0A7V0XFX3_UNCW3|nr:2,3-bisphosphoglycerate-independent phosphoglycerate mutase [candidate division WOR-3 bacterium]